MSFSVTADVPNVTVVVLGVVVSEGEAELTVTCSSALLLSVTPLLSVLPE